MCILYGKSKPLYLAKNVPKVEVNVMLYDICPTMEPAYCIKGYVRCNHCGQPIENAQIMFASAAFRTVIRTNEEGYFKLLVTEDMEHLKCRIYANGYEGRYVDHFPSQDCCMEIFLPRKNLLF